MGSVHLEEEVGKDSFDGVTEVRAVDMFWFF